MVTQAKVSLAEYEAYLEHNDEDRVFELIGGEIVEVPSNPYVSMVAGWILTVLNVFVRENRLGYVTGADGGYMVNGDVYAPDVGFISLARQEKLVRKGFNPNPPDLAVEVISDPSSSKEQTTLRRKIVNYLAAGTVIWVVDADAETIEVYVSGQRTQIYGVGDTVPGGAVLPGFELDVTAVFQRIDIE